MAREIDYAAGHRRDGQDVAFSLLQLRQSGVEEGDGRHDVCGKRGLPLLRRIACCECADVGDYDVYAAALGGARGYPFAEGGVVGGVDGCSYGFAGVGEGEYRVGRFHVGWCAGAEVDCGAFG